ncbi:hypothetical protein ANAEL_03452 [Anaerolineales bacterium]|nr:hypothetical protein ANAEL_03452 [Anaerolineales bacterium]
MQKAGEGEENKTRNQFVNRELRKMGWVPVLSLSKHSPRVGTRVEVRGEGGGEIEEGIGVFEGCIIGAEVYHDHF